MRTPKVRGSSSARQPPLAIATLVLVGACVLKNGPKYPDVTSFCNGRAMAECSQPVLLDCAIPNATTCIAKRQQICLQNTPTGTIYNPSAAENCVGRVSDAYADATITKTEFDAINAACLPVFDGVGGSGASCQIDTDCKVSTGLRCVPLAGSNLGTCQVPQSVQGGGSCAASNALCLPGFHCGPIAHCDIDAAAGEMCNPQNPCAPGLQCSNTGMCVAKSMDGMTCASADECANGICNKAMTSSTGVCVSQVSLAVNEPFCIDSR